MIKWTLSENESESSQAPNGLLWVFLISLATNKVVEPPKFKTKKTLIKNEKYHPSSPFLCWVGKNTKVINKKYVSTETHPHLFSESMLRFLNLLRARRVLRLWDPKQQFVLIPGLLPQVDSNPNASAVASHLEASSGESLGKMKHPVDVEVVTKLKLKQQQKSDREELL